MDRLLVINGCSHSAGSEVITPLKGDGKECRLNCFGTTLANKLDREPVHLAMPGGSNDWIARSTATWVSDHAELIKKKEIDVIFLIHWAASERWEFRFSENPILYRYMDHKFDEKYKSFTIYQDTTNVHGFQKQLYNFFQRVFAEDSIYWSDNKIKNIIFTQELLKNNKCKYWFGNAFDSFEQSKTFDSFTKILDKKYFPYLMEQDMSFYYMLKNKGFKNQSEKIWHHGKDAHDFYADWLEKEFKKVGLK